MIEPGRIGQLLMVGFDGPEPSAPVRRLIQKGGVGGVILFARNLRDPGQIVHLTNALQALSPDCPLFIGIDQEGGRVSRLSSPFTAFPPAATVGALASEDLARRMGEVIGAELGAVGITLNFAPVLDVATNPENPVIGDRAFGSDPALVGRMGVAFFRGLESRGIIAVGKHFPGHGDTALDSHLDLPVVRHQADRLRRIELPPFAAAVRAGIPALMTAHVLYPAWDADLPATLSPGILSGVLRRELGFAGLVVSDDLEMRAVADRWSPGEAAVRFLVAGGDLVLVCHRADRQEEVLEAIRLAAGTPRLPEAVLRAALERVAAVKARYLHPARAASADRAAAIVGCPDHRQVARGLLRGGADSV